MPKSLYAPAGPDWIHEIKHDGFRLLVQLEGDRVRLFTRNGHDWTDRYPFIVEAARASGPAVLRWTVAGWL
jgi:ATP-dependent DNA ligase